MRISAWFLVTALVVSAANAAQIDLKDPRRAVGTDDDIRVDAELTSEFVAPRTPIGVTYKVRNSSRRSIAVAEKVTDASYDNDSATVILSIGSEVPVRGEMPRLVVIGSGETRTFTAGASLALSPRDERISRVAFVQIRVNVLRDAAPFVVLSERQKLSDAQFDQWLNLNEAIDLNALPVRYRPAQDPHAADASKH